MGAQIDLNINENLIEFLNEFLMDFGSKQVFR